VISDTTVDLTQPLAWETASGDALTMLEELQPNILKAHVRDRLSVLLLRLDDAQEARVLLKGLVEGKQPLMKSARTHLDETKSFNASATPGTPYLGIGLTFDGYAALDIPRASRPNDLSFVRGMRAPGTQRDLGDPPVEQWDAAYREPIHAIVLMGDKADEPVAELREELLSRLPASVSVVGTETGIALCDEGRAIEHFGYVDGRSQPLFLVEDVESERAHTDGVTTWDPSFPLGQIIVPDPAGPDRSIHFGSYLVFRKLEQNVARFHEQEARLADQLGLVGDEERERAGAMLVGRFEDGTPLTLQEDAGADSPPMNDFTYASDRQGTKCPMYAHVRKVNPRVTEERRHLMARRGQAYGERDLEAEQKAKESRQPIRFPTEGVGLLFMAFNADISEQFEYTQRTFANVADSPSGPTSGVDPIIGQGPRGQIASPTTWGGTELTMTDAVAEAVTMKGGEYFFVPSLAFLRAL
jgi:Dyp-type peroxidase family